MYVTFIKIDSLQHLEISRQTYPTNLSKIRATTFCENNGDCHITMLLSLKTMELQIKGDQ